MKTLLRWIVLALPLAVYAFASPRPTAAQDVLMKKTLSLDGAQSVINAATDYALSKGAGGAIAVVDDGGNLLAFARLDGTFSAGANVSIGKARTAAMFKKPTAFFEDVIVAKGRVSMTALPDFTPLQGGVPILVGDQIVGAVGVSGAHSAQEDSEIAEFAAKAISDSAATNAAALTLSYYKKDAVDAAFKKGESLFESPKLKVNASRRDGPGEAEVHIRDTDIFYVTAGEAVIVTGGELVDGREAGTDERLGRALRGGEERRLVAGDVLVVPAGTPHWFREVKTPFTYYVVKTR